MTAPLTSVRADDGSRNLLACAETESDDSDQTIPPGFDDPEFGPAPGLISPAFLQEAGGFPETFSLESAVDWALGHNRQIIALELEMEAAEAARQGTRLLYMPTVDLGGRSMSMGPASSIEIPVAGGTPINIETGSTDITSTLSLTLTQPVYMFGSFSLARSGASLALNQSRLQLGRTKETVRRDTEETFLLAALSASLVDISTRAVESAEERLRIAEVRFDAGDVARFEVLRSQVNLATSKEELLQAETASALAMSAFVQKLGLPSGTQVKISPPDASTVEPVPPDFSLEAAWETALQNRMDLAILETAVGLAQIGVDSQRNRPSLIFQGNYSYADRASGFGDRENWSLILNLAYTLYDSGRAEAAIDEARSRRDSLRIQTQETETLIALEVEGAYRAMNESIERIKVARATLETAREAVRIAELGYAEGVIPYIDYQDADLGYRRAETLHLQAVFGYLIAQSSLRAAMGMS